MDLGAADLLFGRSGDWTFHCLGPAALKQQQREKNTKEITANHRRPPAKTFPPRHSLLQLLVRADVQNVPFPSDT